MPQTFVLPRQVTHSGGEIAPGAVALFYQTGTTTPQAVYEDVGLTTPVLSITADSAGILTKAYLNPNAAADYRVRVETSAGVLIYQEDNISRFPFSQADIGGVLYPITAAETAATVTPSDYAGSSRPWTDAVLRYGLNGDGVTDNTAAVTNMCAIAGQALFIKRGTYETGKFTLPANTTLMLEPGTIIRDTGALGASDQFVNITNDNVHIIGWGAEVTMTRADYTTGEQRHGVFIYGAHNVCVEGLESNDCGGDGFYIGGDVADHPINVKLDSCKADNNRRQGLSITQGEHLRIIDFRGTNTTGTNPQDGIDIEPNETTSILKDIVLVNPYTAGNVGIGVQVHLINLDATSEPVSIDVWGHKDVGSGNGARVSAALTGTKGHVRFHAPEWKENTPFAFSAFDWEKDGVLCEVFDPKIIDANANNSAGQSTGAAVTISRALGSTAGSSTIGGVHIYRPDIRVTGAILPTITFYVHNENVTGAVDDVRIIDPVNVEYSIAPTRFAAGSVYVRDSNRVLTTSFAASATITGNNYYSVTDNSGAVGTVTWDIDDLPADGKEWTFLVRTAQIIVVRVNQANAANRIMPGSYTQLQSNDVGASMTLKKDTGGWWVTNMVGIWRSSLFTITNDIDDHGFDADTVAVAELADIVATLIKDLRRNT